VQTSSRGDKTKTHTSHKSIWTNKSSVNPQSTSNQSSKPCTVLQYPSRKTIACSCRLVPAVITATFRLWFFGHNRNSSKCYFKHIELPAKLADDFLRSSKSNINQLGMPARVCQFLPRNFVTGSLWLSMMCETNRARMKIDGCVCRAMSIDMCIDLSTDRHAYRHVY